MATITTTGASWLPLTVQAAADASPPAATPTTTLAAGEAGDVSPLQIDSACPLPPDASSGIVDRTRHHPGAGNWNVR